MSMTFIIAALLFSAPYWHVGAIDFQVSDVEMITADSGWACATIGPLQSGFLRYDGSSWFVASDTCIQQLFYRLDMINGHGWAVGEQFNFPDGLVYEYAENTWSQSVDPMSRALQSVSFPDDTVGWAVGAYDPGNSQIIKYVSGTWAFEYTSIPSTVILRGVHFASPEFGIAVGINNSTSRGAICECINGTWQLASGVPDVPMLNAVWTFDNGSAWVCGLDGTILKRNTAGTWDLVSSPTDRRLNDFHMFSTVEGWAVGDSGTVLKCSSGVWSVDTILPVPNNIYCVSFATTTDGWLFFYSPFTPYYEAHYYDQVDVVETNTPTASLLAEVPSICSGTIRLRLVQERPSQITLYDCSGQKCVHVETEGKKYVEISTSGLSTGVYIVQIRCNTKCESFKVIFHKR
jgi:hypothetical protein